MAQRIRVLQGAFHRERVGRVQQPGHRHRQAHREGQRASRPQGARRHAAPVPRQAHGQRQQPGQRLAEHGEPGERPQAGERTDAGSPDRDRGDGQPDQGDEPGVHVVRGHPPGGQQDQERVHRLEEGGQEADAGALPENAQAIGRVDGGGGEQQARQPQGQLVHAEHGHGERHQPERQGRFVQPHVIRRTRRRGRTGAGACRRGWAGADGRSGSSPPGRGSVRPRRGGSRRPPRRAATEAGGEQPADGHPRAPAAPGHAGDRVRHYGTGRTRPVDR